MTARSLVLSLLFLVSVATPLRAQAAATPEPYVEPPRPGLLVVGNAVLERMHVSIDCSHDPVARSASCLVVATGTLRAVSDVELVPPRPEVELDLTLGGVPLEAPLTLAAGTTVTVEARTARGLAISEHEDDAPWVLLPNRVRHVLFGESTALHRSAGYADAALFEGNTLEIAGEVTLDTSRAGPVDGTQSAQATGLTIGLVLPAPTEADPIVQNGGPYVGGGFWGSVTEEGGRGELRVGYELSIVDWVIVGLGFETDFDSIAETVLVELASPELAVIIPSVSVGIGAVFRQLGARDADAALRLALGYQYFAFGAYVSFDYWPTIADWTMAAGGRLSF